MKYELSFGSVGAPKAPADGKKFRVALLGDFSARANRGEQGVGSELAKRKPMKVDVDNIDDLVGRMGLELSLEIGSSGETVDVEIGSMDDFHPDELYDNLEMFEELGAIRRKLDGGKWEAAAESLQSMVDGVDVSHRKRKKPKSRGASVPTAKLGDFEELMGRSVGANKGSSDAAALVASVVAPFVVDSRDAAQDELIAKVDEALSDAMRSVLHHPDFQTVESTWRTVELLVRRIETGRDLEIVLFDITAEELAADLASSDDLEETGLYKLLVEQPASDAHQGPLSVIAGLYSFEMIPPHAELLGRMAKLAAACGAPFLSGIANEVIRKPDPDDLHPLTRDAWEALQGMPEAKYLGLACPRIMLRQPYGPKSDPIDPFEFHEFTTHAGISSMLWANGAAFVALLLAETFRKSGSGKGMKLGSVTAIGDVPYHYWTDADGDQIALPCTDRLLSERTMTWVSQQGLIPVISVRGAPEARLGGFFAVGGGHLAGVWGQMTVASESIEAKPASKPADEPEPDEPDDDDGGDDGDDDLDALLAELGDDDDDNDSDDDDGDDDDDDEMDPELAALLAELE